MNPATGAYILAVIFIGCGIFSIAAAIAGWEWFFNNMNVRVLTCRMKRSYARCLYFALGVAIIAMGCYMFITV
ncbi:MAG: hypothetical protein K2L31_06990 [Muribaculum sp.]|nr:hypothetical protein [Muribaculum sp.]MDE6458327.1 hypothetical protein [Muribaculum sp.]